MNGMSWEGGFLILAYQKSFSPLPNSSHPLEINVDLTPIIVSPLRLYPL